MKKVHFLGIGGSGASAIAAIAKSQGFKISGCDKAPFNEFTTGFDQNLLFEGHSPEHLKEIDILAVTPAIYSLDPHNPELLEAEKKGIEVLTWQEFMGKYLEEGKFVIAISGTHGKSTTTAMVGQLLEDAGLNPTVELGAIVPKWESNYKIGKGQYFVTEADEFNDNFLASHPNISIVTTIEMDHPEYFKSFADYKSSFLRFLLQTKEKIIANLSNGGVEEVLATKRVPFCAQIIDYSNQLIDFPLKIPGEYNILNASAVYQVGLSLGIDPEVIKKSLSDFSGISRRFEYLGNFQGSVVYTDFAHHPTEILATIKAAREKFPSQKLIVVFQPHMFSRTKALFPDFVDTFKKLPADQIYLLDIYPAREVDTGLVNSKQLEEAVSKDNFKYLTSAGILIDKLKQEVKSNSAIFFLGAGDIDKIAKKAINEQS